MNNNHTPQPPTPRKPMTSSGGSSSSTGSQGNFISITSYVPTMWDNDQTAALKSLIGKDVLGKTASAHQINALTGAISGAAESSSASKEADLADVINAITKLQRKVERFENAFGDMTIELTAGDLTIGKACVRDCNIMAKRLRQIAVQFLGGIMILKIGDIDVSKFILPPDIADTFRSQSVNQTLNGSLVVDRISELSKKRISVQFPIVPLAKWEEIKTVIKPITFNVSVDSSVYSVHLSGDIPTPVLYADGDDVMWQRDLAGVRGDVI